MMMTSIDHHPAGCMPRPTATAYRIFDRIGHLSRVWSALSSCALTGLSLLPSGAPPFQATHESLAISLLQQNNLYSPVPFPAPNTLF